MTEFVRYFEKHKDRFLLEWKKLLSFKSISTDPAFHEECLRCATWLTEHLQSLGMHAEQWTSESKPLVYGELLGNPGKQVVLFYGHYDVQPVDPLDLWDNDPFTPTLLDGRMYARGAQDNKGQLFYFLKALEALRALGVDLPTVKILIEGEEESGSEAMHAGLDGWHEKLKSDVLVVCDTGMLARNVPTITMGLRGIAAIQVQVHGAQSDLHSGVYGGMVLNPNQALAQLLASAYAKDGSVAIPGFYDDVTGVPEADREMALKAPFDPQHVEAALGVPLAGGECALPPLIRRGFRPTLEINGIGGGYQGVGGKTVIPKYAMAKLTTRLVAGQDPDRVIDLVSNYFISRAPNGVRVEVAERSVGGPALRLSTESPLIKTVSKAIHRALDHDPVFYVGRSINSDRLEAFRSFRSRTGTGWFRARRRSDSCT